MTPLVVCICDDWMNADGSIPDPSQCPVRGCVYTPLSSYTQDDTKYLILREFPHSQRHWVGWHSGFFRPTRPTDLSLITRHIDLDPAGRIKEAA